ncbi:BTAD domain-containing putative transcriptional regulator [Nonomuraea turcica]|uniref:BTAD domain-containing putative transcriptional regulator n=1 Tax=Nonomuraea sp. G32 TaxID=3067274 RepID=UPI00273AD742|nr:BTAD domain-containing putative transcriptional regulator [Nonomuraea sp. G32]MDP4510775.1 BTAD domain-containing putative transcriptional regulator [Nonomuraea sp. G32]
MQFGILGPLSVRSPDGDAVAVGGARPRALLAMLLLDAGRTVSVERLIDGQYGDDPPAGAANAVQAQVSRLRRRLPTGLIEFHGAGYRLAVDREDVDAHRFERLVREGRRLLANGLYAGAAALLRDALDLWRGPALADVSDAPFAAAQSRRLEELRLATLEDLLEAELALPEASPVGALRELVAAHPLRERARGLLMRALLAAGRQAEALAVYEDTRRLLADELGADPSPELAALHLEILRGERHRERAARTPPPTQLTSFVGREEELARLDALREARLVTIVGPGGTGKTRLAIEAGPGREACFVDLSLVDATGPTGHLAPVDAAGPAGRLAGAYGSGQVAAAVLGALGLRESALRPPVTARSPHAAEPPDPAERLVTALAEQELTIILDNCEHVITEAATLARRLLASCPRLTILATSREPLGITGEHLVPLAPLPTPPPDAEDPYRYPAVRLFADRAAAVRQGFTVGPHNVDAVLRICAALDGLPLAIELAAARVRTFGVEEIATRLAEHGRFRLLSRGDRTAAARHQTLRAVVEWSWSLLDAEEQELARRFSVFAGGATLEAIERVCGEEATGPLAGLVDKSLVETDGERYQMLDTIRLFCAERLAEAGEEERLRQAHATWFLELARRADEHLYRAEQLDWLARLSADNANLRAALRWSVEHDAATALRLVAALAMYWWLSGRRDQATAPAVRLLDTIGPEPPAGLGEEYVLTVLHALPDTGSPHWERARAIIGSLDRPMRSRFGPALWGMIVGPPEPEAAGRRRRISADPWSRALEALGNALLALLNGAVGRAERELETVLADFSAVGERWGKAQALDSLALIASWRGDWARAMGLWKDTIGLLEELGALDELVDVLRRRADARLRAGDASAARADCERAEELARAMGRPGLTAEVQLRLAEIARWQGDLAGADDRLAAALEVSSEGGVFTATGSRSRVLTALGRLAQARGDVAEAGRRHHEALAAALASPLVTDLADVAEGLAGNALFAGASPQAGEKAAVLLGVAVALRGTTVAGDRDVAEVAAAATRVLGPEAFAAAYAKGAAMGQDDALSVLTRGAAAVSR